MKSLTSLIPFINDYLAYLTPIYLCATKMADSSKNINWQSLLAKVAIGVIIQVISVAIGVFVAVKLLEKDVEFLKEKQGVQQQEIIELRRLHYQGDK